jgi:hypothetical protein
MRAALLILLVLVLAAPADAEVFGTRSSAPVSTVALLGDGRPVWGERRTDGSVIAALGTDGAPRVLATDRPRSRLTPVLLPMVRADDDDVLLAVGAGDRTKLFAGKASGTLPRRRDSLTPVDAVQLGGGMVGDRFGLIELATGAAVPFPRSVAEVLLGDGLVATQDDPAGPVVVSEVPTGRERYRTSAPPGTGPVQLLGDGTLLFAADRSAPSIATPAAPTARVVPVTPPFLPILGGDRILTRDARAAHVFDLAGTRVHPSIAVTEESPVAFDGQRVAWVEPRCGVSFVLVRRLGQPRPRVPDGRCSVPSVRVGRLTRDDLTVTVRCPRTSRLGCEAFVGGEVRRVRGGRRGAWQDLDQAEVRAAPGERVAARLDLQVRLARRGTYEVRVRRDNERFKLRRLRVRATS